MITYDDFEQAAAAKTDEQTLCGTYKGDQPVYFLAHAEATADEVEGLAFEVRHGRPMSGYEKFLLSAAREIHAKEPA
jgi:hypothetical protein